MTTATFRKTKGAWYIDIRGHAGYSDKDDIVCSAVSMLVQTLLQCLEDEEENLANSNGTVMDGHVVVTYEAKKPSAKRIDTITKVIELGFKLLSDSYPKYVTMGRE